MKKKVLDLFPYFKLSPLQEFNNLTKIDKLATPNKKENWPQSWIEVIYKGYPRFERIALDRKKLNKKISFMEIISKRHSSRNFKNKRLSKNELSQLLYHSSGLKNNKKNLANRFYPSAGSRYPLEIYLSIFNVQRFKPGIYHFNLRTNSLEYLWVFPSFKKTILSNFNQEWVNNASVIFIISAVFFRSEVKYGNRAYRHILLETGALTQNIYLITQALKLKCCSIGGFIDDNLNSILDLDGDEESVIAAIAVGK